MDHGFLGTQRRAYYRSIFISDLHMGAKSFDAPAMVDFLKSCRCDTLYLVGDIIDGWKLNKRWYWNEDCDRVLDELVKKTQQGARVIYLPGNHDEEIRRILPLLRRRFAKKIGIEIKNEIVHTMQDGRKFLVLHGDQFDRKILKGPLSQWSDHLYDSALEFIGRYRRGPQIKIDQKLKPFSLAKSLSKHGQKALQLMNNFENAVYETVKKRGLNGLICGHTHIPTIKPLKDVLYANSGSWLRTGHTALVETLDGKLELIDWPFSADAPRMPHVIIQPLTAPKNISQPESVYILNSIRKLWPSARISTHTKKASVIKPSWAHLLNNAPLKALLAQGSIHTTNALSPALQNFQASLYLPVNSSIEILAKKA